MAELRTLGRLELVDGESSATHVVAVQPKRLALLAYLTLASPRGPHRREALLALFWPELNENDGRRALRQALHGLRQHLGEGLLESARDDRVGIGEGDFSCDAIAFERALDAGDTAGGLAHYHGDFLEGVFVSDVSPDFEQWVDATRARLRGRATIAASALATAARSSGDRIAEVRLATEASRLAPDDEPRVRALMRALRDSGDRAGALRSFQLFTQRMAEEYDAQPSMRTVALADAMRTAPTSAMADEDADIAPTVDASVLVEEAVAPTVVTMSGNRDDGRAVPASRRWRWLAAGGVMVALALAAVVIARARTPSPGVVEGILVADFGNHTRDSLLAGAVTEALRADLSQSRLTRVMSRPQVQSVLKLMRHPPGEVVSDALVREVAERYGVKAFVTGDVASIGTGFTVSAALISVKGGEIIVSVRESAADSSKLLAAVDAVSDHLRRGVGESLWAVRASPSLEQVTTSSLQALRLYSQAIRVGDLEGESRRAMGLLREAVALDTTFAMAYRRLAVYQDEFAEHANAVQSHEKAFRYRAHLPELERLHIAASYYQRVGLHDSAIGTYRVLLDAYPADARALNNLADIYMQTKNYRRAEPYFQRAIEADSSIALLYNHLATDQFNAGDYEGARHTLMVRRRKFPRQQDAEGIDVGLAMMRGDFDAAKSKADSLLATAGTDVLDRTDALQMLTTLAIIRGRLEDAMRYRRDLMELQAREGSPSDYIDAAAQLSFLEIWYRHDTAGGLRTLDAALVRYPLAGLPPLDRQYAAIAYVYALAGEPARARATLSEIRAYEAVPWHTPAGLSIRDEGGYLRALGAAEIAEGRYAQAVVTLRRSVDVYFCPSCAVPDLARAFELAGQPDSAIAQYNRYVTMPWSEWRNAGGEFRVSAYGRLGALHEGRGEMEAAIHAYDQVVALWGGADAELQPVVADARRRAAALRGTLASQLSHK